MDEAGRAGPFAVALGAVMLEDDRPAIGEVGQIRFVDHGFAVEHDRDGFSARGNLEFVPFADRFIGLSARGDGGAHFSGDFWVHADAIHFAGANRPAPNIHLVAGGAADVNAGIGVGQGEFEFLAFHVFGVGAVGQDVGNVWIDVRRVLDAPFEAEDVVAVFLVAGEAFFAFGFTFGIVIDDPVEDFPVAVIAFGNFPSGEVATVEERNEAVFFGSGSAGGECDEGGASKRE